MVEDTFDCSPDEQILRADKVMGWRISHGIERKFLCLGQRAEVLAAAGEMVQGWRVVIYETDDDQRVLDWDFRYEIEGARFRDALDRFTHLLLNDLIQPSRFRRLDPPSETEAERLDSMMCEPVVRRTCGTE